MRFLFYILTVIIFCACWKNVFAQSNCELPDKLYHECATVTPENESADQFKKLYPWHVGLYRLKQNAATAIPINVCGGTLVSPSVMLTAAHCLAEDIDGSLRNISEYFVTAGNDYREFDDERDVTRQSRKISKVILPNEYKGHPSNFKGDIAIVELSEPFVLSKVVKYACLSKSFNTQRTGQTVGWGLTTASRHPDTRLSRLFVPYVDLTTCRKEVDKKFHDYLTNEKFCGVFTNGVSICSTDNGGGVLYTENDDKGSTRWYLDGVTSVGLISSGTCETKQYSAFVSVQNYKPLICQSIVKTL